MEGAVRADSVDVNQFRQEAKDRLAMPRGRVIINFSREALGQGTDGGHWSPLLAYNTEQDAFLLFDVARYKFSCPTYWYDSSILLLTLAHFICL